MERSGLMTEISSIRRHLTELRINEYITSVIPENDNPNHFVHFIDAVNFLFRVKYAALLTITQL